jgi:hypothetical protein
VISLSCRIIGIDPGMKGAMAMIERGDHGQITNLWLQDNLTLRHHRGHNLLDTRRMANEMASLPRADLALFELPIQRKTSKGRLYKRVETSAHTTNISLINYGRYQVLIEDICDRWDHVLSSVWKASLGVTSDKSTSLELARHMFPSMASLLKRKSVDDGRAEALLIAEYAYWHVWRVMIEDRRRQK